MIDLNYVDMEEFKDKLDMLDGLMETKASTDRNIKAIKDDLAILLDVKKSRVNAILKLFLNIRQDGQPFDEELVDKVKELYSAYREVDNE